MESNKSECRELTGRWQHSNGGEVVVPVVAELVHEFRAVELVAVGAACAALFPQEHDDAAGLALLLDLSLLRMTRRGRGRRGWRARVLGSAQATQAARNRDDQQEPTPALVRPAPGHGPAPSLPSHLHPVSSSSSLSVNYENYLFLFLF